jgi:hypothetical protein
MSSSLCRSTLEDSFKVYLAFLWGLFYLLWIFEPWMIFWKFNSEKKIEKWGNSACATFDPRPHECGLSQPRNRPMARRWGARSSPRAWGGLRGGTEQQEGKRGSPERRGDGEGGVALQGNESLAEMGDGRHQVSELTVSQGWRWWWLQIRRLPGFSGDDDGWGGAEWRWCSCRAREGGRKKRGRKGEAATMVSPFISMWQEGSGGGEGEPCGGKEDRGPGAAVEWHCRPATVDAENRKGRVTDKWA